MEGFECQMGHMNLALVDTIPVTLSPPLFHDPAAADRCVVVPENDVVEAVGQLGECQGVVAVRGEQAFVVEPAEGIPDFEGSPLGGC